MKHIRSIVILIILFISFALIACGNGGQNTPGDKPADETPINNPDDNQNGNSTYRISFKTNCSENIADLEVDKNGNVEKPDDPTKDGYIFGGWYSDGKEYDFNTPVNSDLELEAEWFVEIVIGCMNGNATLVDPRLSNSYDGSPSNRLAEAAEWDRIEKEYKVKIKVVDLDRGIYEMGDDPRYDAYYLSTFYAREIKDRLYDLGDLYNSFGNNSMTETEKQLLTAGDKLVGIKVENNYFGVGDMVIYINLELAEKIGVDEPSKIINEGGSWDLESFKNWVIDAQEKLNALEDGNEYYVINGAYPYYISGIANASGVNILDLENEVFNIDDPSVINAINTFKELYDLGCVNYQSVIGNSRPYWRRGCALLNLGHYDNAYGNVYGGLIVDPSSPSHIGYVPFPYVGDTRYVPKNSNDCFAIFKNQEKVNIYPNEYSVEKVYKVLSELAKVKGDASYQANITFSSNASKTLWVNDCVNKDKWCVDYLKTYFNIKIAQTNGWARVVEGSINIDTNYLYPYESYQEAIDWLKQSLKQNYEYVK